MFVRQILQGMDFIHNHKIIHLDIKPFNILFSNKNTDFGLKLIDFGLAKQLKDDEHGVKISKLQGTIEYMAPEVMNCGQATTMSDMWSVGVVAYMLLSGGKSPFYCGSRYRTMARSLSCEYDLTNKSVSNQVDLQITGEISPSLFEENRVDSPNVIMRVSDDNGQDVKSAVVGDPLKMTWEILDQDSPYEIFVRDLVALDGSSDGTELLLIDERGCPTDASIMGEVYHSENSDKLSYSDFDAFRFPTTDVVQFRAMITPCLPKCEPVKCDVLDYTGQTKAVDSFGRKKRSVMERVKRATNPEELLVVQSLKIVDRYGKREKHQPSLPNSLDQDFKSIEENISEDIANTHVFEADCLDKSSMISGAVIFLALQVIIVILFAIIWRRNQRNNDKSLAMMESPTGSVVSSRADSLSYMYDTGFARRLK